jgi:hypothetical protein
LSVATLGIWAVAVILGIALPVMVTGTDPTRIPVAAIFAPIAAAMLTALAGAVATVFRGGPGDGERAPVVASTDGSMPAAAVVASLHHPEGPGPGRAGRGRSIQ